ncbi:hypothetical protein INT45_004863 [Circinella minor]|uniref:Uncharacterized protein n=1 Tax=Circinella minor TaxID=1195481 RepID=A0A8H7RV72_9FUNG|nr:hypothetical protein INT45_004863 [Circinella minor]
MFNILFEKKQYHDSKNVIGFKVDVRLLIDHDGKEYDLCSGELAKEDDHDKIILDKAKLNRESKDNLDCILDICKEDEWTECKAWQFQAVGGSANLNSIHLVGNGSYAVIARYRMTMSASIGDLPNFIIAIKQLLTWRKDIYGTADMVTKRLVSRPKLSRPQNSNIYSAHTSLQRETIYTPPEGSRWKKKPIHIYGYVPVDIQEKLLTAYHSSTSLSSSTPPAKNITHFARVDLK